MRSWLRDSAHSTGKVGAGGSAYRLLLPREVETVGCMRGVAYVRMPSRVAASMSCVKEWSDARKAASCVASSTRRPVVLDMCGGMVVCER